MLVPLVLPDEPLSPCNLLSRQSRLLRLLEDTKVTHSSLHSMVTGPLTGGGDGSLEALVSSHPHW